MSNRLFFLTKAPNDEIQIWNVTESNAVVGVIGFSLTLQCSFKCLHLSNISWSTNGTILGLGNGKMVNYKFIPFEKDQNASYICSAVSKRNIIRKRVKLNLIRKAIGNMFVC